MQPLEIEKEKETADDSLLKYLPEPDKNVQINLSDINLEVNEEEADDEDEDGVFY